MSRPSTSVNNDNIEKLKKQCLKIIVAEDLNFIFIHGALESNINYSKKPNGLQLNLISYSLKFLIIDSLSFISTFCFVSEIFKLKSTQLTQMSYRKKTKKLTLIYGVYEEMGGIGSFPLTHNVIYPKLIKCQN